MRALVYDGNSPRYETRYADPVLGPDDALIRPLKLGVCATDIEICRGYMGHQGVLGHEFVGVVEKVNDTRRKALVGQRVVGTIYCVCEQCDMCRAGLPEHCRSRSVLGISGRNGCFSDSFTLPVRNLITVPDAIDDDRAVFVEPLAAACQIARQLKIEGRPYITILGDGRLGLLCAQVTSRLNATVRCVGKHPEKLELCAKWGVKHRLIHDVGLRQDQDIVVDCTGSTSGMEAAMKMVRPRGTIVLKTTVAPSHAAIDLSPLVIHEIHVIGSRCGPFPDALDALASEQVDVLSLISRRMKLADGIEALKAADRPDTLKVLMEP